MFPSYTSRNMYSAFLIFFLKPVYFVYMWYWERDCEQYPEMRWHSLHNPVYDPRTTCRNILNCWLTENIFYVDIIIR